jgi:hypothetical protein
MDQKADRSRLTKIYSISEGITLSCLQLGFGAAVFPD